MIKSINEKKPETWKSKVFLTMDIDWAHDDILSDTIDIVEQADSSATWFVTHDSVVLERLRSNPKFELGIHPNFNSLFNGEKEKGANSDEILERILEIVPEAKSVRSHSMTQSSVLLNLFKSKSLTHDCNTYIPNGAEIVLKPWKHWNEMTRVPYFWEDDVACMYDNNATIEELVQCDGLKVFDFHPIHIFLNTESLDRYERTRHLHQKPEELIKHRYEGEGSRTRLLRLLKHVE